MADPKSHEQQPNDPNAEPNAAERSHGHRIPGRDFAGTSFASNQREQTADHRGESRDVLMDDIVSDPVDRALDLPPRDES